MIISQTIEKFISNIDGVKQTGDGQWAGKCPNKAAHKHGDRKPSLSIKQGDDGRVLVNCHGGCSTADIMSAMGMKMSDLFPPKEQSSKSRKVATYQYINEDGELLYEALRYEPKDFRQRRPDGHDGHIWNMNGVRRVLYRLPELLAAGAMEPVFIVEGEKDVETLRNAGLIATCNVGGAGKWRPDYNEHLRGRLVVIIADKDGKGRDHARKVATSLHGIAASVKVMELPGDKVKDASDWFAAGGTPEALRRLVNEAAEFDPDQQNEPVEDEGNAPTHGLIVRWLSDITPREIEWFWQGRMALGKLNLLFGDPGLGKSFITTYMAAMTSIGGAWPDGSGHAPLGKALIVNYEDDPADTIWKRAEVAGADITRVAVIDGVSLPGHGGKPTEKAFTLEHLHALEAMLKQDADIRLLVLDPVSAGLDGKDSHNNSEIRGLLAPLAKLASDYRLAVVMVTHMSKGSGGRAMYRAMGSLAFIAAARSAWAVVEDETDYDRRYFVPAKNNLGNDKTGLAYRITDGAVAWEAEPVTMKVDDLLAAASGDGERPGPEPEARNAAAEWLAKRLSNGPVYVGNDKSPEPGTLRAEVKEMGAWSWHTVRRAYKKLGVINDQCPYTKKYRWRLPDSGESPVAQVACPAPTGTNNLGNLGNQQVSSEKPHILPTENGGCPSYENLSNQSPTTLFNGDGELREELPDVERGEI